MIEKIKELCEKNGTSGREEYIRQFIESNIKEYDEIKIDKLSNLLVFRKGKKSSKNTIALFAHMDEVGIIVTGIDKDGFVKFSCVGGIDARVLLGRRLCFENGVIGVVGLKPIHLLEQADRLKMPKIDEMYIDIGAKDKEDAEKYIALGDTAVFDSEFVSFGDNKIKAKALDNRVGCAVLLDMLKEEVETDTWFVFTTREEVGLIGAAAASYTIKPDIAIVVETTTAADIAGVDEDKQVCVLGKGPAISFMDRATIYDKELYKRTFEIAKEHGISVQAKAAVAGGNDAGAIHKSGGGVRTLAVNVPCRYLHSPSGVCDIDDIKALRQLLPKLCKEFSDI